MANTLPVVTQLSIEPVGACPLCGATSYAWLTEGHHFQSCPPHRFLVATSVLSDAALAAVFEGMTEEEAAALVEEP